jgi:HlyD family secretion protein
MVHSPHDTPIVFTNAPYSRARSLANLRWFAVPMLLIAAAAAWFGINRVNAHNSASPAAGAEGHGKPVRVEVVAPRPGGIDRVCIQPGTLEPFESADLYSKVSGFLSEQHVDIGSRVAEGQLLAKLAVPEFEKQVQRDRASVERARAHVKQLESAVVFSEAEARSAKSLIDLAEADTQGKTASRSYHRKQLERLKELNVQKAIDDRLVDEKEDQYMAAVGAEAAAKAGVTSAKLKADAAESKIAQAKADLDDAKAQVLVAEADLGRSQVMLAYTEIRSPYKGVITKRSFHRDDFIRSADAGGERMPLFSVERTDKMRVVVQIPDRDVPYVTAGDTATVEIDALPGRSLKSAIARAAESEDPATRTMRTEIDIPNPDGRLARGMYGRVTMLLETGTPTAFTVPSATLTGRADGSKATLRIVRDGAVRTLQVVTGMDNGVEVEILSGLNRNEAVVLRANGPVEDGTAVTISETPAK